MVGLLRCQKEVVEAKKSLATEKEKSAQLNKSVFELAKNIADLGAENTQFATDLMETKSLVDELSAKKTSLLVKLKSKMLRLRTSREKCVQRGRRTLGWKWLLSMQLISRR